MKKKNYDLVVCQWKIYRDLADNNMLSIKNRYSFIKIFQLDTSEYIDIDINEKILYDEIDDALICIFTNDFDKVKRYNEEIEDYEYEIPEDLLDYFVFPFKVVKFADESIDNIAFSVFKEVEK